jgi:hypothetical protein
MPIGKRHRFLLGTTIVVLVTLVMVGAALAQDRKATHFSNPRLLARISSPSLALAPSVEPTPEPDHNVLQDTGGMFDAEGRLARPEMSDPPTQAELGHYQYWMSCMICHGDRGQGLTDEWRGVLDPGDQNCWQSKCHAPNHPPYGFEIPRSSPAVMGEAALTTYKTATELWEYMRVKMPWSYPGLFDDREYWRLTAYLAQANQIDLPDEPLGPHNGDQVLLIPNLPQTFGPDIGFERSVSGAIVLFLTGAAIFQRWSQRK